MILLSSGPNEVKRSFTLFDSARVNAHELTHFLGVAGDYGEDDAASPLELMSYTGPRPPLSTVAKIQIRRADGDRARRSAETITSNE
jgi:hypothetical protein